MPRFPHVPLLTSMLFLAFPALAAESVYTRVDFDRDCRVSGSVGAGEEGGVTALCDGYGEAKVHFSEGDLRQSIFYGEVGQWFQAGALETLGRFNHAGDTVEWRLDRGIPFATIRRWFVATGEDAAAQPPGEAQILVISRVGQPGEGEACVVGYVEATANRDANVLARRVADEEARDFACRYAEPMWHGERRHRNIELVRIFGEPGLE